MGVRSLVRRQQMMDNEDDGKMAPPRPPKRSWHLSSRGISLTVNEEEEEEECDEEEGSEAEAPSTPLNIPPIHSNNNNNHDDPSRPKEFTMLQVGERPVKSLLLPNPAAVSFKSPKCPACGALPCTVSFFLLNYKLVDCFLT
jgi:hypothetical protein